jgi:hypothetical protein
MVWHHAKPPSKLESVELHQLVTSIFVQDEVLASLRSSVKLECNFFFAFATYLYDQ